MTPTPPTNSLINALTPNNFGADSSSLSNTEDFSALTNEQFLAKIETPLKALLQEHVNENVEPEKVYQYARIRRNDAYWRNKKLQVPYLDNQGFLDFTPVSNGLGVSGKEFGNDGEDDGAGFDDYDTAVYKGELRKLIAVIGQRSPNVTSAPRQPSNEQQIAVANTAQEIAMLLRSQWAADKRNRQATLKLGKNGPVFIHTCYVTDGSRYGYHEEPILEEREKEIPGTGEAICPECGASAAEDFDETNLDLCPECGAELPAESIRRETYTEAEPTGEVERYARGNVEIRICSGLEVTTPFWITCLSESPWLRYEYECDKGSLLYAYPSLRGRNPEVGGGGAYSYGSSGDYGRQVREQIKSLQSYAYDARNSSWRITRCWLRPCMFELINIADERCPLREEIKRRFPNGMKLTTVGDVCVQIEHESMDEVWTAISPEEGETLYTDAYLDTMIEGDNQINGFLNIAYESAEKSIPITIADPSVLNPKSVRRIGRNVAEIVWSDHNKGSQFSNAFYQIKAAETRPDLINQADKAFSYQQGISGLLPAVFGAGGPFNTLGEAEMARNQALMLLGPLWKTLGEGWEGAYYRGVMQFAKYSPDGVFVSPLPTGDGYETFEFGDLSGVRAGGWWFQAEEAMPMTPNQLRSYFHELLTNTSPEVQQALALLGPENVDRIAKLIGIPGWKVPLADDKRAVMAIINELAQSQPMQQFDMMGQIVPGPSIPPDPFLYDPGLAATFCREWLNSKDGQQLKDSPGWQNVYLWGKANNDISQMMMGQGGPPMGPGGMGTSPPPPPGALGQGALPAPEEGVEGIPGELGPAPPPAEMPESVPEMVQ